ncbi:MAG: hypothetical protein JRE61_02995 [Deltaproteobacteria bacterium]|nr:hypothetical protein [Deltaproteobacteria bacterium]
MKKVTSLNDKTLIFGNGPCAHYIAEDLLTTGADIVIATIDKACDFSPSVDSGSVEILTDTRLVSCRGSVGNFRILAAQDNKDITRTVAGIIIAEEDQRKPNFSLYGLKASPYIITLSQAKELLLDSSHEQSIFSKAKKAVFLTGLVKESHPAIAEEIMQFSLRLQSDFNLQIYILTNNLKVAANGLEVLYRETKKAGAVYIKFTDTRPEIHSESNGSIQIEFIDEITLKNFRLTPEPLLMKRLSRLIMLPIFQEYLGSIQTPTDSSRQTMFIGLQYLPTEKGSWLRDLQGASRLTANR